MKAKEYKIRKDGYLRHERDSEGKKRLEHRMVWERNYGKIPPAMQIHHIDGNKTNNIISNLQLVTPLEHKRLHSGCKLINEEWYKPCKVCGEFKKADSVNWHFARGWINGKVCKKCYNKKQNNKYEQNKLRHEKPKTKPNAAN